MKKQTLTVILFLGFILNGFALESLVETIKFASIEKAKNLLIQEDDFTRSWSQFDIDSRLHKPNSTKKALFDLIGTQARAWTQAEKAKMNAIFKSIDEQIKVQGFHIQFPNEIYFVKTTAKEEGGAGGYTRATYVVLKDDLISQDENELKSIIVHELFHILTRNNPEFRKDMYEIIGFKLMNKVDYPESIKNKRITNPDAPQTDSYINLKVDGEAKDCMMILYAKEAYKGGDFFKYLNVGFLSLKGDEIKTIEYHEGDPLIYSFEQVHGFFEQVGKNTNYIIHPEEIMADNFSFAILNKSGLPNPEIVNEIKLKLKEKKTGSF